MRILKIIYKKLSWLAHNTIVLVNFIFIFFLLLAYLSSRVNPLDIRVLPFFGLAYPFLLLVNIFFVAWWIIKRKMLFMYSLIAILAGWSHLTNTLQIRISQQHPLRPDNSFTFLSYNVRLFNLYDWIDDASVKSSIYDFILNEDPDIICLQEYFHNPEDPWNNTRSFQRLHENYSHIEYSSSNNSNFNFGIATFSRYPITGTGRINFPGSRNMSIYTDININGDTIRVFNSHLQSVRFTRDNLNFLDSLGKHNNRRNIDGGKEVAARLGEAFRTRSRQVEMIVEHISNSPYPVIITGDLNDTPVSYTYRRLRDQGLKDAFVTSGNGIGNTWIARIPLFRIDYILYGGTLQSFHYDSPRIVLSDHYPLKCEFFFRRDE